MSTWLYLQCLDHAPPIRSRDEVGQHLRDLDRVRAELVEGRGRYAWQVEHERLIAQWQRVGSAMIDFVESGAYYRMHAAEFLADHADCAVGILDEYGTEYDTHGKDR